MFPEVMHRRGGGFSGGRALPCTIKKVYLCSHIPNNMNTVFSDQEYFERLVKQLAAACSRNGWMPEMMPATPDINGRWDPILEGFIGDAVHEFNGYPEVTLAWAGYMGAAVTQLWDSDFDSCMSADYERLKGEHGFDDLDEHVTRDILGLPLESDEAKELARRLAYCAAETLGAMRHEPVEDLTAEAYKVFLRSIEAMYRIGAALQLSSLGYRFEKV